MGEIERPARKSDERVPRKRLSETNHRGTFREKRILSLKLRLRRGARPQACRVHTRVNAWCAAKLRRVNSPQADGRPPPVAGLLHPDCDLLNSQKSSPSRSANARSLRAGPFLETPLEEVKSNCYTA